MNRGLRDSANGGPRDRVSQYGIIAFVCTVTSRRVGCVIRAMVG